MASKFINSVLIKRFHKSSIHSSSSSSYKHFNNNKLLYPIIPQLYDPSITNPNFRIIKRWHVGHSHHDPDETSKEGERIFRLGLAADIGLTAGKVLTGYLSGSTAIIADAAHSLSDVVLSGVALLSFRASRVPKDKEHPYGHGKFETLGALGISGVLLVTAGGIAWHALDVLMAVLAAVPEVANQSLPLQHAHSHHHGVDMDHPILALNMTVVAIAVKEGLYWVTKKAGERSGSGLMKANAWHHRADAVSSLVALIGVGGSILGVRFLDPLAGLVVSGMILKAGLQTGYQSILELVDAAIPSHHLDPIRETVLQVRGVQGCRHLRGRRAGSSLYLDVKIEVDPYCTISIAHQIGEHVRDRIQKSHPEVSEVFIQLEPVTWRNYEKATYHTNDLVLEQNEIEEMVKRLLTSKKVVVHRIIKRKLHDKSTYDFEVSMPVDPYICDILKVPKEPGSQMSDCMQVTFQLQEFHRKE